MNITLTIYEQYVMEALKAKAMNLFELIEATQLSPRGLNHIIQLLQTKKLIVLSQNKYRLNKGLSQDESLAYLNESNFTHGKKFLVSRFLNSYSSLEVKKVYLSNNDEQELAERINELDRFLSSHSQTTEKVKDKKIIIWGMHNYSQLLQS